MKPITINRPCIRRTCAETVTGSRRACDRCWRALPGELRSRLSISAHFPRSPATADLWRKADQALNGESA